MRYPEPPVPQIPSVLELREVNRPWLLVQDQGQYITLFLPGRQSHQ